MDYLFDDVQTAIDDGATFKTKEDRERYARQAKRKALILFAAFLFMIAFVGMFFFYSGYIFAEQMMQKAELAASIAAALS